MSGADESGRYEHSDADARPVFVWGLVLALVLAGALAVSAWLSQSLTDELRADEPTNPIAALQKPPEGPMLQAMPARELELHRAWEAHVLAATEWIDPLNKVVRIPVERAMELVLAEGFPVRKEGQK